MTKRKVRSNIKNNDLDIPYGLPQRLASPKYNYSGKLIKYKINNETFIIYDYYKPIKILGKGAYAIVIECIDIRTNKYVAIKKNFNIFDNLEDCKRIYREILLLKYFKHNNIIKINDIIPPRTKDRNIYNNIYIVMPKIDITLYKLIYNNNNIKLNNKHIKYIIYQLLMTLKYIHKCGIIHRDITPNNILINYKNCKIKIIDFGLSREKTINLNNNNDNNKLTEYITTRWYRAPEIMVDKSNYNEKMDIWAVGAIWGEMLIKKPLFKSSTHLELLNIILKLLGTPNVIELDSFIKDDNIKKYIINYLPNYKGYDLRKLFNMINDINCIELIKKMLNINPNKRVNINDAINHPYFSILYNNNKLSINNINIDNIKPFRMSYKLNNIFKNTFSARNYLFDKLHTIHKELNNNNTNNNNNNNNITYFFNDNNNYCCGLHEFNPLSTPKSIDSPNNEREYSKSNYNSFHNNNNSPNNNNNNTNNNNSNNNNINKKNLNIFQFKPMQ